MVAFIKLVSHSVIVANLLLLLVQADATKRKLFAHLFTHSLPETMSGKINFSIDRGGTFTDVYAQLADGKFIVAKLLSVDTSNYPDAPREGIRRILQEVTGKPHPRNVPVDTSNIGYIRMGTTVATNALLERKGSRTALVITKGFKDLLYIGNQSRPSIFDLEICKPEVLYETVLEIDERVQIQAQATPNTVQGITGEHVQVLEHLNVVQIRTELQKIFDSGIRSLAVVFMHSYTFARHEQVLGQIAEEIGFEQISLSSQVMPMVKIVPRGYTSCADAYLTPVIKTYIESFRSGFDKGFDLLDISFMQSDGGLTKISTFSGHKAILSGPAGGVVGYALTTFEDLPVIGFDMGGTSTDVSRYDGKSFDHVFETTTAGITIQAPQLDIQTVAAGGGSCLFYRDGMFVVGPESASADPGPVCYRKPGGVLAVTDANLVLGRILPNYFPKIFGPNEDLPLDVELTRQKFKELQKQIKQDYTVDEIAHGFIRVANEAMCRPIRNLTQMKGFDVKNHVLACFGGAGPQHACAIARSLGIPTVFVHRFSGILSAYGLSLADIVIEKQEPCALAYDENTTKPHLLHRLSELGNLARAELDKQGFTRIELQSFLNLRYEGTDVAVMTSATDEDYQQAFIQQYQREFGFTLNDRRIMVDDIRVRGVGKSDTVSKQAIPSMTPNDTPPEPIDSTSVYFEQTGRVQTPIYTLSQFKGESAIAGPAIIMQDVATVIIEPNCRATITRFGDIKIQVGTENNFNAVGSQLDPIQLAIFSHRFMGIAEQMGRTLQRTSISVNIKERLDFSCAIFGPDGGLVANAPHLPVHLGSMQQAVRYQLQHWKGNLCKGDVLVSNHPQLAGGSHLPDITVITPVFNQDKIVFFLASRGHHSDIGGIAPGSMPPLSKTLRDEGAAIIAFKLVDGRTGSFDEAGITELLMAPSQYENNYGTRNLRDNLSDLKAQVAANTRGVALMSELIDEYGLETVHAYMNYIQENAETAVRRMLYNFSLKQGLEEVGSVSACDYMDDGTRIQLQITIDRKDGSAVFDFTGTGPQVYGNINAPPAVTYSAIIYCLRCLLVGHDIPLNQGCLNPISVILPPGCLLNPSDDAAVVGGNVLTSQRVTDVILKAFKACAASQGCMNNLTFGDETMGYYETIAGGAGAGPHWNGRSGVHTHMTNTRITDPEILERRYPVLLKEFSLCPNSGGRGQYRGGDGVIRELQFCKPLTVSILSERRAFAPYGLNGGESGSTGQNLVFKGGRWISLGGKNTICLDKGDKLRIKTPGGGGYGTFRESQDLFSH